MLESDIGTCPFCNGTSVDLIEEASTHYWFGCLSSGETVERLALENPSRLLGSPSFNALFGSEFLIAVDGTDRAVWWQGFWRPPDALK